jgi:hypothetical protein
VDVNCTCLLVLIRKEFGIVNYQCLLMSDPTFFVNLATKI